MKRNMRKEFSHWLRRQASVTSSTRVRRRHARWQCINVKRLDIKSVERDLTEIAGAKLLASAGAVDSIRGSLIDAHQAPPAGLNMRKAEFDRPDFPRAPLKAERERAGIGANGLEGIAHRAATTATKNGTGLGGCDAQAA